MAQMNNAEQHLNQWYNIKLILGKLDLPKIYSNCLRKGSVMRLVISLIIATFIALAGPAAQAQSFEFTSIDGDKLDLSDYRGRPILIANTASRCGFTKQYNDLQNLYDTYADKGLVVLAVPSNDFKQELATNQAVQDFCEVNFGLTLPMTEIVSVRGDSAHPLYQWLANDHGFQPKWNFYKVLIDQNGDFVRGYSSTTKPMGRKIRSDIEQLLGGAM
jgi:glutathione peroxidase